MKVLSEFITRLKQRLAHFRGRLAQRIGKNPIRSFYFALTLLVLLIIASNVLGTPKPPVEVVPEIVKEVNVFTIGSVPSIKVLAKVEKAGVITITALTPGVVQQVKAPLGTKVTKGQTLLTMSSNYQGGNTSSVSRQLAQVQYTNARETKDRQLELVRLQRELAEKVDVNADELREITEQSIDETNDLLRLNDDIISTLDATLLDLESTNVGGANDALILSTKQMKAQFLAARNAARQGVRMAEFSADDEKSPSKLSDLQRDIALRQLDLQEKMVDVNTEVARLQLALAQVVEGMMYPASPIKGTVDRVFVTPGQVVNPGTELMVISGESQKLPVRATAYVAGTLAKRISATEESTLYLSNGVVVKALPTYISREGVQGTSHGVSFVIPHENAGDTTENGYIAIELPVGYADTTTAATYVPIDAVYQSKDANIVFVDYQGVAQARTVVLGDVTGSFVEVKSGLGSGDAVILNRNVLDGDRIRRTAS